MSRIVSLIEDPTMTGRILGINQKKVAEMPFFLLTNDPENAVVIPASQSVPMKVMTISGEGPASVVSLAHQKTGDMLIFMQIQDGQTQFGLMNQPVHIDTVVGSGLQPYRLPEALYLDELRSLQVTFTDISAVANEVRLLALANRMLSQQVDTTLNRIRKRMEARQYLSIPYWYTFDGGAQVIGAGATVQATITVGQDHHFQIFKMAVQSTGLFDIDIVDSQKGESIITAPNGVHYPIGSDLILGNGNFPFVFHEPRLVQVGQRLIVTMTDRSAAPNTVFLTLGGRAVKLRMWQ